MRDQISRGFLNRRKAMWSLWVLRHLQRCHIGVKMNSIQSRLRDEILEIGIWKIMEGFLNVIPTINMVSMRFPRSTVTTTTAPSHCIVWDMSRLLRAIWSAPPNICHIRKRVSSTSANSAALSTASQVRDDHPQAIVRVQNFQMKFYHGWIHRERGVWFIILASRTVSPRAWLGLTASPGKLERVDKSCLSRASPFNYKH